MTPFCVHHTMETPFPQKLPNIIGLSRGTNIFKNNFFTPMAISSMLHIVIIMGFYHPIHDQFWTFSKR
jgi:hypothetical protein